MSDTPIEHRAMQWMAGGDTGASSLTIARHMTGMPHDTSFGIAEPADGGDLGRCLRLLRFIPEWRSRMSEMAALSHAWAALVPHWDEIDALLRSEIGDDLPLFGRAPKTYERIKALTADARKKDGWVTIGNGASVRFK